MDSARFVEIFGPPSTEEFLQAVRKVLDYYAWDEEFDYKAYGRNPPNDHIWYSLETLGEYLDYLAKEGKGRPLPLRDVQAAWNATRNATKKFFWRRKK